MEKYLYQLKVTELQNELAKRHLDKYGLKATLIDRLKQALKSEGHHDPQNYKFVVQGVQHLNSQYQQRIDSSHQCKESSKYDHKTAPRYQSKERETTQRNRSPLHRNEARGNNKDSRISNYGHRNEDEHQKRASRGEQSAMTTDSDRTMGTRQPFNKRNYYAEDETNIDNRHYSTERQHPSIHSPPQDHGTHSKNSPLPRAREIFPNDRFGSEITAESYMAAVRIDTSYASRISQAQQPISRPTNMAFGNNPSGMNTNQQRGGNINKYRVHTNTAIE